MLKLQYFGRLMQRADTLENTLILGKIESGRRGDETGDEMVGWHHRLNGREFEKTLVGREGQGSLECCSPGGCKESDTIQNWITQAFATLNFPDQDTFLHFAPVASYITWFHTTHPCVSFKTQTQCRFFCATFANSPMNMVILLFCPPRFCSLLCYDIFLTVLQLLAYITKGPIRQWLLKGLNGVIFIFVCLVACPSIYVYGK